MRNLFLAAILCVGVSLSTSAYAQRGDRGDRGARQDRSSVYEKLDLTDKQKEELKTLNTTFKADVQTLRKDKNLNDENRKTKMNELRTAHQEKVNNILTPEQKQQMEKIRSENPRDKKKDKSNAFRGEKQGRKAFAAKGKGVKNNRQCDDCGSISKHLNLTDAQKEQIKQIRKNYDDKERALKNERKNEITKVYTPEQQAKLKQVQTEKFAQKNKITIEGATKLMALNEGFKKEKQAITLSRIAPDAQKAKLKELSEKHKIEVKNLKKQYSL